MNAARCQEDLRAIRAAAQRLGRVQLMEVCGTHTVALFRSGLKALLPENVRLVSGPGCPVCVTAQGYIDAATTLAARSDTIICTYGDMVRVPGREGSLERQRARGARVRVMLSALDAVRLAAETPAAHVVFLGVGFETTAPATAAAVCAAERQGLTNFSVLSAHKLVVPALLALLAGGEIPIDGFLCPGHVSVIIGADAYAPVVARHRRPCVVAGFEPPGMLAAIAALLGQLAQGAARIENVYSVAVTPGGNPVARELLDAVFETSPARWRAIGEIPASGLRLRERFARYDAWRRFDLVEGADYDPPGCRCGEVIQGKTQPAECALFGTACTPLEPVGPCMVSSEGACAAWYKYGRAAAGA